MTNQATLTAPPAPPTQPLDTRILRYTKRRPGASFAAIRAALDVTEYRPTLEAVDGLIRTGQLRTEEPRGQPRRYYATGNARLVAKDKTAPPHFKLTSKTDEVLINFVREHPGLGLKDLAKKLNAPYDPTRKQLNVLESAGIIVFRLALRKKKHVYIAGADTSFISGLTPLQKLILDYVETAPGRCAKTIAHDTHKGHQIIKKHIGLLRRRGLVVCVTQDGADYVYLPDQDQTARPPFLAIKKVSAETQSQRSEAERFARMARILDYVRKNPGQNMTDVARGLGEHRQTIVRSLRVLESRGAIKLLRGPRQAKLAYASDGMD